MYLATKTISKLFLRVILHLVFWIIVLLFYIYFFGFESDIESFGFYFALVQMPITISITYLLIYHLIPKYLLLKRYLKFGLYITYTLIISSYLIYISIFYGLVYLSKLQLKDMPIASKSIVFIMVGVYAVVFLVSAFKLMQLQIKSIEQRNALEQKVLATQLKLKEQELHYLKMQIHPHFLFNTLNTIYGFALKKANEAPEMILKLSNLLDYLLYQVVKPYVMLEEEINHIKDYIALEELRFNNKLVISLFEDHDSNMTKISPMILLPFVENSFKHGTLNEGKLTINITIKSKNNDIYFSIENDANITQTVNHGIGLKNIKKRLELLYNKQYSLKITNQKGHYKIDLKLKQINTNV